MNNIVLKAENLGKRYVIGAARIRYPTLREALASSIKRLSTPKNRRNETGNTFWALRDISFDIQQGEVVGIIGRNGAGKSTLLKLFAHITEPSEGRVSLDGRVGSLLEVGTGFHPELTGRDNIYMNGAILGMRRTEIDRKFDEIIAFAEIEKFLDTPVKRYSSGMYVRLAFAVAAHLEPEILLVDEVLAVGDAQFQKKCLGKMSDVARGGRTVLFVSHNMAAIQNLCTKAFLLDAGRLVTHGDVKDVVSEYLLTFSAQIADASSDLRSLKRSASIPGVLVEGHLNGKPMVGHHLLPSESHLKFDLNIELPEAINRASMCIYLEDIFGIKIYGVVSRLSLKVIHLDPGRYSINCELDKLPLIPGQYYLGIEFYAGNQALDWLDRIATLDIEPGDIYGTGELPASSNGYFLAHSDWKIEKQ
jgi:lipopolysaccharide transport system ATP-binding protein